MLVSSSYTVGQFEKPKRHHFPHAAHFPFRSSARQVTGFKLAFIIRYPQHSLPSEVLRLSEH